MLEYYLKGERLMKVFNNIDAFGHQEYIFKEGNVTFKINYRDNFDLYWSISKSGEKKPLTYQEFIITKENHFIYNLFEKLYYSIANANPYESYIKFGINIFGVSKHVIDFDKFDMYNELFDGEKITWVSDNRDYDKDSLVSISKNDDAFVLEFAKKDKENSEYFQKEFGHGISIRFCNSGSYYAPFNDNFMEMYNSLNSYSTDFGEMPQKGLEEIPNQIHISDYLHSLKKK